MPHQRPTCLIRDPSESDKPHWTPIDMSVESDRNLRTYVYICSTWECVRDQKGGTDKRSIKYRPPATQGEEDYTVNRLYLAEPKNEDR